MSRRRAPSSWFVPNLRVSPDKPPNSTLRVCSEPPDFPSGVSCLSHTRNYLNSRVELFGFLRWIVLSTYGLTSPSSSREEKNLRSRGLTGLQSERMG